MRVFTLTFIGCDQVSVVANAIITGSSGGQVVGATRTYACQSGHSLKGSSTITCGEDGQWSEAPICLPRKYRYNYYTVIKIGLV